MNKFVVEKHGKMSKMTNSVLISGLPGIGNVGKIAVDFMIEKLKAKKILSLYSSMFPAVVYVNEGNVVELPKFDFYYFKKKSQSIIFLTADFQPSFNENETFYLLSDEVVKIVKSMGVKEIITIGGIGHESEPENPKVHCLGANEKFISKLKKAFDRKVVFNSMGKVGVILGMAGTLMGISENNKINSFTLLGETSVAPGHIGIKPARDVIKVLMDYLKIDVPIKEIDKEITSINKIQDKLKKQIESDEYVHIPDNRYIG
ncbi:MAG: PAC2 family protein [Candidatus Nanoarchaeia archaeon]|nr:PAC2 family protein [Candidatus Nanoarchaeia archaeon]